MGLGCFVGLCLRGGVGRVRALAPGADALCGGQSGHAQAGVGAFALALDGIWHHAFGGHHGLGVFLSLAGKHLDLCAPCGPTKPGLVSPDARQPLANAVVAQGACRFARHSDRLAGGAGVGLGRRDRGRIHWFQSRFGCIDHRRPGLSGYALDVCCVDQHHRRAFTRRSEAPHAAHDGAQKIRQSQHQHRPLQFSQRRHPPPRRPRTRGRRASRASPRCPPPARGG